MSTFSISTESLLEGSSPACTDMGLEEPGSYARGDIKPAATPPSRRSPKGSPLPKSIKPAEHFYQSGNPSPGKLESVFKAMLEGSKLGEHDLASTQLSDTKSPTRSSAIDVGGSNVHSSIPTLPINRGKELDLGTVPWHQSSSLAGFDNGWEPSPRQIRSYSASPVALYDIPSPLSKPLSSGASGRCIVAARAYEYAINCENTLRQTLADYNWEGAYFLQVGFNEDLLKVDQGVLQEIHVHLERSLSNKLMEDLAAVLNPFPITFHTPETMICIPEFPVKTKETWDLWTRHGIYRPNNDPYTSGVQTDSEGLPGRGSGSPVAAGSWGGGGDNGGQGISRDDDSDPGDDESYQPNGGGNGESDKSLGLPEGRSKCKSRGISIPFSSIVTCEGEESLLALHPQIRFKTIACVDIKIEANARSLSRPPNSNWGGPWIETKMTLLDAGVQENVSSSILGYTLGLAQLRIVASSCATPVLQFLPTAIGADGDNLLSKGERNIKGGIQATLSANPSVKLEGAFGSSVGEERVRKRWDVFPHCLGSERSKITGSLQTTMMWKYVHNDQFYRRTTGNTFDSKPSVIFGLSQSSTTPQLEIEVTTHYSSSASPGHRWFNNLTQPNNPNPAYLNFLHQTNIIVNLKDVEDDAWVVGLGSDDIQEAGKLGVPFPMVIEQAESNSMRSSQCKVSLGRALYGRVNLAEDLRSNSISVLDVSTSGDVVPKSSQISPPTPPEQEAEDSIKKIPSGYLVGGRCYKERSVAERILRVLKNKNNCVKDSNRKPVNWSVTPRRSSSRDENIQV